MKRLLGSKPKVAAAVLVPLAALVIGLEATNATNIFDNDTANRENTGQNQPNSPKTGSKTKPASTTPKDTPAGRQTSPPIVGDKKQVEVTITSAGRENSEIVVRAYASGVFENGGSCTAAFTKGGAAAVSGQSTGFENVSYTTCSPIRIARSKFTSSGSWNLVVNYQSATAEGRAEQIVEIN
ncbi:hypothetical protein HY380_01310 [Candidatus Saccharibacteria bacterium]|nr:hypothetical protein [Candidatus Saccharibacteria bacterium]